MIGVVYPRSLNWFYQTQALAIAEDLTQAGVAARAIPSDKPNELAECGTEVVLLVCFAEALVAAERQKRVDRLLDALKRVRRRVLVNFDSVRSTWFTRHFETDAHYFSDIFDVGLYRQIEQATLQGIPYQFIPESLARSQRTDLSPWGPGRVLPWTMLGHATRDRAALIEAVLRVLPKNGFVFSPPLRPFTERSGLNHAAVTRILRQTDLYIWGSHHLYPYHETQRVLHALVSGAVPVKIDPMYSNRVRLPWVYPSLEAMLRTLAERGYEGLYATALRTIEQQGTLGDNMRVALERIGVVDPGLPSQTQAA